MRQFDTGATRDDDAAKLDFEGFLSPDVLVQFALYMNKHRKQADGKLRASDNWQKGIPKDAYMKSMWRHFFDVWVEHRNEWDANEQLDSLMALLFNVQGYALELIRDGAEVPE